MMKKIEPKLRGLQWVGDSDVRVTPSCGNVFKDIGLPDADELFLKAKLGLKVFSSLKERQISLQEAASLFEVEVSEIEPLFNGEFSDYSAERLEPFHTARWPATPSEERLSL